MGAYLNVNTWRRRQEDQEFQPSLGYQGLHLKQEETKCCLHIRTDCGRDILHAGVEARRKVVGSPAGGGVRTFLSLHSSLFSSWHLGENRSFLSRIRIKNLERDGFPQRRRKKKNKRLIISSTILLRCFPFDLCLSKRGFENLERGHNLDGMEMFHT